MKIALIQIKQNRLYDFPGASKFSLSEMLELRTQMERQVLSMIRQAAQNKADLIVTTEAFNYSGQFQKLCVPYHTLYDCNNRPIEDACASLAHTYHCNILAGLIRKEKNNLLYNSTVYFNRSGKIMDIYHKVHLAGDENQIFTPGEKYHTIDTEFGRLGLAICWDMHFAKTSEQLYKMGAQMILCPTWGLEQTSGIQKASEHGLYIAAAMAVPYWMAIEPPRMPSTVIAPDSVHLVDGPLDSSAIIYCDLPSLQTSQNPHICHIQ